MKISQTVAVAVLTASFAAGCRSTPTPSASPPASATSATSAVVTDDVRYVRCEGQPPQEESQRAPSLFVNMDACRGDSIRPVGELARQTEAGVVNEAGNCAYPNGVTCHYHTAKEFLEDTSSTQEHGVGELHCIVPSDEPQSPIVFGAHIRCRSGTEPAQNADGKGAIGASCDAGLLSVFAQCGKWDCCDDGTLTNPLVELTADQKALHPDFRMCSGHVLEVDCRSLVVLDGHPANAPALGGIHAPFFTPGPL